MLSGECLCGAIRYEIDGRISPIWFCHCSKCRRSTGTAFQAAAFCRTTRFRWVRGEESISEYRSPSGYRPRFCGQCGSPVPQPGPDYVWLPMGTLDGDPESRPARHIFTAFKAEWFEITDDLPQYEEQAPERERSG